MRNLIFVFLSIATCSFFLGCNSSDKTLTNGTLSMKITDAPFPTHLVKEANININKIEVRKSEKDENKGNPYITIMEENKSFNLLELTNGVTETLTEVEIPVGQYDLIRIYISNANVILSDGSEYELKVPSGASSGLKVFVNPSIQVAGGLTSELLLDVDVSRSFIPKGNSNSASEITGFNFKPVLKVVNLSTSGRLVGQVTDSLDSLVEGATITVFAADTVNTSALTDENGEYTILGLLEGNYDLQVEFEEYQPVSVEGISITPANETTQNIQLTE